MAIGSELEQVIVEAGQIVNRVSDPEFIAEWKEIVSRLKAIAVGREQGIRNLTITIEGFFRTDKAKDLPQRAFEIMQLGEKTRMTITRQKVATKEGGEEK